MRIAIVKLSSLGDIIHGMIVLQFIKRTPTNVVIDWVVDDTFKEILEENPHINTIISLKIKQYKQQKSYKKLWREIRSLKKLSKYDAVIDMQGSVKSAIIARFIPSKTIVGFDKNSIREKVASYFYTKKINIAYTENTIIRNLFVTLCPLNISFNSDLINDKATFLFYKSKQKYQNYVVFVINSTWESRNYPLQKFLTVANLLQRQVYVLWSNIKEQQKAKNISAHSQYINVAPKLNIEELKAFIAGADLVIGNDTGPTHMAWGLNVPSITLFGPTPTNRIWATSINKSLTSNSVVNHTKLNKNDFSISEIEPTDVVNLAHKLLINE